MIKKTIPFPSLKELLKIEEKFPKLALLPDEEIRDLLYYQGDLSWKLDCAQKEVREFFLKSKEDIVVVAISRQTGKSYGALIQAFESCLKYKDYFVRYATGAEADALKILQANVEDLIVECPEDLKPAWKQKLKAWVFPNGSRLYLEGVEGAKANKRRGGKAHFIVIDEAAFISNLVTVVQSVYSPMTTTTGGKILIISTPPSSRGHEFNQFVEWAKEKNAYYQMDIYQYLDKVKNEHPFFRDRILPETIERKREQMLPEIFAKEYLLKYETNLDDAVIPEFDKTLQAQIVKEYKRPKLFYPYVAMDQAGIRDLIAVVFGYYDPTEDKIIVEQELQMESKAANTRTLAENIKKIEAKLWGNEHGEITIPVKRYCDINEKMMIKDLHKLYGLKFLTVQKTDTKENGIKYLRTMLFNEVILINPRCKNTIFHLETATWNKAGTSFDRSTVAGHYDFVDAMVYLSLMVKRKKLENKDLMVENDMLSQIYKNTGKKPEQPATTVLKKIFRPKIRRFGS